ncbi:hypothetical protein V8Z74_14890 [Comamonas sp. w2-DMI]|uniref:hypothetical protein n=1 Tax=Comamonas sp. w2-DMI TaxID=3126391 RepID=UPI0032E3B461
MIKQHSENIGSILELRAALTAGDDEKIEALLGSECGRDLLGHSLRFALCNYVKETEGLAHTINAVIWAVPVLIYRAASSFVSTGGQAIEVIDNDARRMIMKYFGHDCRIRNFSGVMHADLISGMEISNQAKFFGAMAEDARFDGVMPTFKMPLELAERIESGMEPELCFIVGSASRINRMPKFNEQTLVERERFSREMQGRLALHSMMKLPSTSDIRVGAISNLADAYEEGMKFLIQHLADTCLTGRPYATLTSSHNFIIRFSVMTEGARLYKRELHLNTSLVSMEAIRRIFEFASSRMGSLAEEISNVVVSSENLH